MTIDILLNSINDSMRKGAPKEALQKYGDVPSGLQGDPRLSRRKADIVFALGRPLEAAQILDEAARTAPEDIGLKLSRAQVAITLRDFDHAVALLADILDKNPTHPGARLSQIHVAFTRGDLGHALDLCDNATDLPSDSHSVLHKKATILQIQQRFTEAGKALDEALELAPGATGLLLERARVALRVGDSARAAGIYRAILKGQPHNLGALFGLFELSLSVADQPVASENCYRRTRKKLENALKQDPSRTELTVAMGDLAFKAHKWNSALKYWGQAGCNAHDDGRRLLQTAQCYFYLSQFERAEKTIREALRFSPNAIPAHMLLSHIRLSMGDVEDYMEIRQRLFEQEGLHRVSVGEQLIYDYPMLGYEDLADETLRRCLDLEGQRLEINFVNALVSRGQRDEALKHIQKWAFLEGETREISSFFERMFFVMGKSGEPSLKRLREKYPEHLKPPLLTRDDLQQLFSFRGTPKIDHTLPYRTIRLARSLQRSPRSEFRKWRKSALQATEINMRLKATRQEIDTLLEYIEVPDLHEVEPFLEAGSPLILVTSHQGPLVFNAIEHFFPGLKSLMAATPAVDCDQYTENMILTIADRNMATVKLVGMMKAGKPIIMIPDQMAPKLAHKAYATLCGVELGIPNTAPKLSYEFNAPSFWIQPQWRGTKIHFDIKRLPSPLPDEPVQVWCNRWAAAYFQHLEQLLRGDPRNLDLTASTWRYLLLNGALRRSVPPDKRDRFS